MEFIEKETELYKAATELSGMYKGNVMIAAYSSIAAQVLPQIIKDFTDPNIKKDYLFYNGQTVEADIAYSEIYSYAKKSIHIIDNYINIIL